MPSALAESVRERLAASYLRVGELIEVIHADSSSLFVQGQWSVLTQTYRDQRFVSAVYSHWTPPSYLVRSAGTVPVVVGDSLVIDGRMLNVVGVYHPEVDSEIVSTEFVVADTSGGAPTDPALATHADKIATHTVLGHVRIGESLVEILGTGMIDVPAASIARAGISLLASDPALGEGAAVVTSSLLATVKSVIDAEIVAGDAVKAAAGTLGNVRIGSGLAIDGDGIVSVTFPSAVKRALWLQLLPADPSGTGMVLPGIALPYKSNGASGATVNWVPRRLVWDVETVGSANGVIQLRENDGGGGAYSSAVLTSNLTLTAGNKSAAATGFTFSGSGLAQDVRLAVDVITLPTSAANYTVWLLLEEA